MSEQPLTPQTFDPSAYKAFRFAACEIDRDEAAVHLRYAIDEAVEFVETVRFDGAEWPQEGPRALVLERLCGLLHLFAGVSYYKTAAPPTLQLESTTIPISQQLVKLLQGVYTLGLGEFAFENKVDILSRVDVARDVEAVEAPQPQELAVTGKTLVAIGGGKDSMVALEVVRDSGREPICFSVGAAKPIVDCIQASGLPSLRATRSLSPNIGVVNKLGALNGHVPVTSVVSMIALITAVLNGVDTVAMANERSASEANLNWNGLEVNHQWSKGLEFERALDALIRSEISPQLRYLSVLRPASELAIARAFSALPQYHRQFTSCNKVFRLDPEKRFSNWCADCPKCRFVYLALSPTLGPEQLVSIFGRDMLDDASQFDGFADLAGLREHKPFECVGEEAESLVAMQLAAGYGGSSPWSEHKVIALLNERYLKEAPPTAEDLAAPLMLDAELLAALPEDIGAALKRRFTQA